MTRARAVVLALAASFSIYLILLTAHGAWLFAEALFQSAGGRSPRWMAANFAVALFLQVLAVGFFYWFFVKPGWRRAIPLMLAFPVVFLVLQRLYLITIPTMFLEEPDVARENSSWPVECTAPGVYQTNLRTASELWVRFSNQPNNYAVLTMPGCRLAPVSLPQPKFTPGADFMIDITSVVSGVRAIVQRYSNKERRQSWWLVPGTQEQSRASMTPLEPPASRSDSDGPPILSTDGQWVAWLEAIRIPVHRCCIRSLFGHSTGREGQGC